MKIERLTEYDLVPLAELFRQFWGEKSSPEKRIQEAIGERLAKQLINAFHGNPCIVDKGLGWALPWQALCGSLCSSGGRQCSAS